ncbi:MAG: FIST N-terminal domain-containing protein [Syntrophobacteraceae bacterium]|nr:FIST N-terminal domain-containing protein [Syntrophobacteraceae bacterium]
MNTESGRLSVKIGQTTSRDEQQAVCEFYSQVCGEHNMDVVIFFCSSLYDLVKLGTELKRKFTCPLIGCTTSGEISPKGYQEGGIVGAGLTSSELKVHPRLISSLDRFGSSRVREFADGIRKELSFSTKFDTNTMFGFLTIDGLSMFAEQVISLLYSGLDGVSIIGGSAGDDLRFAQTMVYWDGQFLPDAAVFSLLETTLPFYVFKTQHFGPTEKKLVITAADPSRRIVSEINAEPAAEEFARILDIPVSGLNSTIFSQYPLMLKIGDSWYVRSIQKVNEDGSLSLFSAIDAGLVLTVGQGENLVANLENTLGRIHQEVANPRLIIGCDCILRKLEIVEKGLAKEVDNLLVGTSFVGFSTYGEQYDCVHVNQTLTGVAIGE